MQYFKMKKIKYICNGKTFNAYEDVVKYAESLGLRITNTENIRSAHLITLSK